MSKRQYGISVRRPLLAAIMLVLGTPVVASPYVPSPTRCEAQQPVAVFRVSNEISLIQLAPDVTVEQLSGDAALSHLSNLQSRKPAAFAKSKAKLTERGFRPTDTVFVERTMRRVRRGRSTTSPYFRTEQYSEQNAEGEIVYWSWTDGNDATWEGTIYVEIYSDGAASTWDGQIDASTEEHTWLWYEKTWESPPQPETIVASLRPTHDETPYDLLRLSAGVRGPYLLVDRWYDWAVCHRANVLGGCGAAALGCLFTGPGWAKCFGAACVSVQVGSAITCYLQR